MKQSTSDLQSVSASLDEDFGVSGGIPGIVENLTKMFGNMALAGAIASSPSLQAGAAQLASNGGVAAGLFNQQYFTGLGGSTGSVGPSAYSSAGTSGAYPGDAALLFSFPTQGKYNASGDLAKGLGDCSSAIEDLVNIMDGRPTAGRSMSTANEAEWLASRGFQPGIGGPGDFRVGFNSAHTQATLPGGTPFNWGSDAAAARGGVGGTGADDPAFTDHWYRPVGAGPSAVGVSPSAMGPAPLGGGVGSPLGNLPLPLPVTIVGGGVGVPGGMPVVGAPPVDPAAGIPGTPTPGVGTGPAPGPAPTPGGWGLDGLPGISSGGGQAFGAGMTQGATGQAAGFNTGVAPVAAGGGGFKIDSPALDAAGSAADMFAPGSSVAIKLGKRAVEYGAQVAGIAASGVMETVLPSGSALGSFGNSWLGKLAGGFAGAKPAKPNLAGGAAAAGQQGATPPQQGGKPGEGDKAQQPGGAPITVNYTNNQATEDRAGANLTNHLSNMNQGPGR
ncbi:hypothetical protein [Mycobacterium sp. AT1]|uniref:hypothetical protein n=1 Tax=Mycobacterium sp. AT1 TaxID=1961706 RepID=UPI0009ADEE88|nr:hypothetical protein [Mycobacterium sp. AT1]OPX11846.1 hypothetical protein B1790_06755 [Mycobacterium sp. AT1]